MRNLTQLFIAVWCALIIPGETLAELQTGSNASDHAAILAPFLNDETFVVAYIDLASLGDSKVIESSKFVQKLPREGQLAALMLSGFARQIRDAGGQAVYVLVGLGDLHMAGGPVAICTPRAGLGPDDVEKLRNTVRQIGHGLGPATEVQRKGDILLVGPKASVTRYAGLQSAPRNDVIEPLTRLTNDGAAAAAVFCPGPDFRRVVRELWPELPGVLAPLRGELADRWQYFETAVRLKPEFKPHFAVQTTDPAAANLFVKLWRDIPIATTQFGGNQKSQAMAKRYAQLFVDTLQAKVEGTRVVISFPTDEAQFAKLQAMFGEAADASMEPARRGRRVNQFKQISIAMQNYHDTHKRLPAAAIRDKDGKPLLSWRVAILPYFEQDQLYKQFHLDEPWDSPHNRGLIEKMPAMYADPDPKMKKAAREGRTTYQVPVGPGTVFGDREGISLKEITDGTSRTIVVVEVEPQWAVVWTKPEDWEVDEQHPRRGIERKDRERFTAGYADAHVSMHPVDIDEKTLKGLLTRAGGEDVKEQ